MKQTPVITYFGDIVPGDGGGAKIQSQSKINAAEQSEISAQIESKDIRILTHFSPATRTF